MNKMGGQCLCHQRTWGQVCQTNQTVQNHCQHWGDVKGHSTERDQECVPQRWCPKVLRSGQDLDREMDFGSTKEKVDPME